MAKNTKQTSGPVARLASETLQDPSASKIAKTLAGAALSQRNTAKQTGADMEAVASKVLSSDHYAADTKKLAATVLSQANKTRKASR